AFETEVAAGTLADAAAWPGEGRHWHAQSESKEKGSRQYGPEAERDQNESHRVHLPSLLMPRNDGYSGHISRQAMTLHRINNMRMRATTCRAQSVIFSDMPAARYDNDDPAVYAVEIRRRFQMPKN